MHIWKAGKSCSRCPSPLILLLPPASSTQGCNPAGPPPRSARVCAALRSLQLFPSVSDPAAAQPRTRSLLTAARRGPSRWGLSPGSLPGVPAAHRARAPASCAVRQLAGEKRSMASCAGRQGRSSLGAALPKSSATAGALVFRNAPPGWGRQTEPLLYVCSLPQLQTFPDLPVRSIRPCICLNAPLAA